MAEPQTQTQQLANLQQATWQPPLYDSPPFASLTNTHSGATPSPSYPPLPASDATGRGLSAEDKPPSFVTNAGTIDEERGLLSGHPAGVRGTELESHPGKPDLAARGDWLQTWRENKRLILVRTPLLGLPTGITNLGLTKQLSVPSTDPLRLHRGRAVRNRGPHSWQGGSVLLRSVAVRSCSHVALFS